MKRFSLCFVMCILVALSNAQDKVTFEFSDGIENGALKTRMEQQVSKLLTAINQAETNKTDINYRGVDIDNLASQSIGMLWNNVRFRILDSEIVEHCLRLSTKGTVRGYQVRNIAVEMKPLDASYTSDINQEVCIDFDSSGRITDFNLTMGLQQYTRLMKEGVELDDLDRRMQIIHYCEQFQNAYSQKDISFMENVFSDDALIITGKVVTRQVADIQLTAQDVKYTVQTKAEYLKNLRRAFNANEYVNVKFKDYKIKRHGAKPNYYGVTLYQEWNSTRYSDKGIVFLVWDFTDDAHPKIHVRTWQPSNINENDVFTLSKFKLP